MEILSAEEQVAHAREIYNKGDYKQAAHEFSVARKSFETQNLPIKVAEMANNQSVALLKSGNPQGALDIVLGTEIVFEKENEILFMAMAIGNSASALDALERIEEAEIEYKRRAKIFKELSEDQLYAETMKSLSALQLKSGRQIEAIANMQSGFDEIKRPNIRQRMIKKLLELPSKLLNR